ncbi:MAG TPA: hypothetical protein VJW93_04530 [Candidatus Acidoferrales bacterium]|nr:hypothetical protein [Candidatus Acidoferrales bacterium]
MRAQSVATLAVAIPLLCVLLVIGICRISAIRKSEVPVGNLLGDQWLRMSHSEKIYFVEGYKRGSSAGQTDACDLFSDKAKSQLPSVSVPGGIILDRCEGRARSWSVGTQNVAKEIDNFYMRFPDSRDIHVTNLILNLSDQAGLTVDQIHEMGSPSSQP